MISQILIKNFRCFKDHRIFFKPISILVGQNNAGKSTLIEALRLVSIVAKRYKGLSYKTLPSWLDLPHGTKGVTPSLKNTGINFLSLFHLYSNPPCEIEAIFESKVSIKVFIGPEEKVFAVIKDSKNKPISSKIRASQINIPKVEILPQVGPLAKEETILNRDYVLNSMGSTLSHLHFRNQLNLFPELFEDFKMLTESSWPGLKIDVLENGQGWPGDYLNLFVRDGVFEGEVGWMGHGLQMWLQIIWFLILARDHHTVIFDEPDVYMHADLQRKLFRLIRMKFPQLIIATHSTEIISEANPDEILLINKERKTSRFAISLPAVQEVIEKIGSIHNLHLTRLWHSNRFLMVEGDDVDFLKCFQNILFPESQIPIEVIPRLSIKGWGGWNEVKGSSKVIRNAGGECIITYCILDRDYHTQEEIEQRKTEARKGEINLHIWSKKEIENFLLVPKTIQRLVSSRCGKKVKPPSETEICDQIETLADSLKDFICDNFANEIYANQKEKGISFANKMARGYSNDMWKSQEGRFSIIPGKRVISMLSNWTQKKYNTSISPSALAYIIQPDELDNEVISVLSAIEKLKAF